TYNIDFYFLSCALLLIKYTKSNHTAKVNKTLPNFIGMQWFSRTIRRQTGKRFWWVPEKKPFPVSKRRNGKEGFFCRCGKKGGLLLSFIW
ncbi:hypothetical protein, partial [uncultured Parabacteroides sp.]|uniref:hypothetical protein n=1 Tax=uncultured Parabacteroides sp. TaxID=512312 RepID=UPI0028061EF1